MSASIEQNTLDRRGETQAAFIAGADFVTRRPQGCDDYDALVAQLIGFVAEHPSAAGDVVKLVAARVVTRLDLYHLIDNVSHAEDAGIVFTANDGEVHSAFVLGAYLKMDEAAAFGSHARFVFRAGDVDDYDFGVTGDEEPDGWTAEKKRERQHPTLNFRDRETPPPAPPAPPAVTERAGKWYVDGVDGFFYSEAGAVKWALKISAEK